MGNPTYIDSASIFVLRSASDNIVTFHPAHVALDPSSADAPPDPRYVADCQPHVKRQQHELSHMFFETNHPRSAGVRYNFAPASIPYQSVEGRSGFISS